jgi:hypothetical protein
MRFAVATPDPAAWLHVRAFDEVAEALCQGLRDLGHACERLTGSLSSDGANILFGAHHLPRSFVPPPGTILFNLEQIVPGSLWVSPDYLALLRQYRVWDYSARNVEALRAAGVARVSHAPLGYVASLERIVAQADDIDVLFYGRLIPRRVELLDRMRAHGMRVVAVNDAYAEARDALIASAKVILNLHVAQEARLEVARCFYAMINGRFVLSEDSPDAIESGLAGGMAFAAYGELLERCAWYLARPAERAALARAGRSLMRARPQAALLRPALAELET